MDIKAKSTKEKILESSLALFSQKGYKATTVRDIAGEVGIRQGAIYNHFKNKEEILETLVNNLTESALVHLFEEESESKTGKQLLARIATTFKLISFDPRNEALFRLMMQELFRNEKIRDLYHERFYQQNVKRLSSYLFQMMQEELIRSSDPLLLANEFFAPLFYYQMQVVLLKMDGKSTSAAVTMFEKHVDLFWDSIRIQENETIKKTLF